MSGGAVGKHFWVLVNSGGKATPLLVLLILLLSLFFLNF